MNDDNLCELYANLLWRPVFYFLFLKSFDLIYFFARSEVLVRLFLFSTAANIISVIGCAVGYVSAVSSSLRLSHLLRLTLPQFYADLNLFLLGVVRFTAQVARFFLCAEHDVKFLGVWWVWSCQITVLLYPTQSHLPLI
jgi:hypothetical protein